MKQAKKLLALILALTMVFGIFAFTAQAKGKAAPISLNVEVSSFESGYTGLITVAVTVKNISGKDVKNIVVTSCGSKGLCMFRPLDRNVVISNLEAKPVTKKNAVTACLKPGGTMKYIYCALLGYQYAKDKVPEATRRIMLEQHKHIGTKNFRSLSIKTNYVESSGNLTFGDIKTLLDVKAYYNVKSGTYKQIAGGSSVTQDPAVRTAGNYSSETAARSAEAGNSSSAASSANASSSSAAAALSNAVKTAASAATSTAATSSSASASPDKNTVRTYILNTETKVYHSRNCGHWPTSNRVNRETTASKLESEGYTLCEFCAG